MPSSLLLNKPHDHPFYQKMRRRAGTLEPIEETNPISACPQERLRRLEKDLEQALQRIDALEKKACTCPAFGGLSPSCPVHGPQK
jgi:hypothetical protein